MTTNARRSSPESASRQSIARGRTASRVFGALRLVAATLVFASITTQVVDESVHNDFIAKEYFSYFTIQSSLINVVILVLSGLVALRHTRESRVLGVFRASVVSYAVVTAVVYNLLLRGLPDEGYVGIQWPNEVIHVWVPLFVFIDWLVAPSRPVLRMRDVRVVIFYPLVWLAFTFARGGLDNWFPYPFLQPNGPNGWGGIIVYVLGISAFIVVLALVLIAISRARWANTDRLWMLSRC